MSSWEFIISLKGTCFSFSMILWVVRLFLFLVCNFPLCLHTPNILFSFLLFCILSWLLGTLSNVGNPFLLVSGLQLRLRKQAGSLVVCLLYWTLLNVFFSLNMIVILWLELVHALGAQKLPNSKCKAVHFIFLVYWLVMCLVYHM